MITVTARAKRRYYDLMLEFLGRDLQQEIQSPFSIAVPKELLMPSFRQHGSAYTNYYAGVNINVYSAEGGEARAGIIRAGTAEEAVKYSQENFELENGLRTDAIL